MTHDPASDDAPLVSVIMPAYQAQATIGAAISGVLTQTYPNYELVVVDDGSTDRTEAICRSYGDLIRYERTENGGSSAARNHAFTLARGELIALCDSDDIYMPRYLEAMVAKYRHAGAGRRIVMSDAMLLTAVGVGHGRHLIGPKFPAKDKQRMVMLQKNFVPYLTLFPRRMLDEIGNFDTTLEYCEDWEFFLRAVLDGWEVDYQDQPLALYRWTPGSKSTREDAVYAAEDEIMRRAARRTDLTEAEQEFLELRLGSMAPRRLELRAAEALREGEIARARSLYAELARVNPADRRVALRSSAIARIPGVARLWRARNARIDAALGRTEGDRR